MIQTPFQAHFLTKLGPKKPGQVTCTGPTFAGHCPKDMAAIDAALAKNPTLSAAQMAAVKKDRADGEELHKAGKHAESLVALCRAEKVLGLECVK